MSEVESERASSSEADASQIREFVQRHRAGVPDEDGTELAWLTPSTQQLQARDHQQDIALKKKYANWLLGAVVFQLVVANGVFVAYAWVGKDWDLDAVVIDVWLAATLVQVIGVVAIVTRYLFPRRDSGEGTGG